ncbi:MAG: hypothetical protein KGI67_06610 [Pseudomonadota bacterium]|nr:hypothetical protein [Pseudomonadota bacterium]
MEPAPAFPGKLATPVITALRRILRPLVRLMLTHGVTYPLITDVIKSTYVDVARREFRLSGKRQTDSRISLLTGVHRKDVKRLIEEGERGADGASGVSLGAALVARWLGEPELTDAQGRPLPLPRLASDGGKISFEALVESVSKDIRSRVILDEWLRVGVVQLDRQDRVVLNPNALAPARDFGEKLHFLEANVHDHLAAAVHNLSGGQPPMLERSVFYDQLSAGSVDELRRLAAELAMHAIQVLNRRAIELERDDREQSRLADQRINFGAYFYHAPRDLQAAEDSARGAPDGADAPDRDAA